jgi:hypothetical protein
MVTNFGIKQENTQFNTNTVENLVFTPNLSVIDLKNVYWKKIDNLYNLRIEFDLQTGVTILAGTSAVIGTVSPKPSAYVNGTGLRSSGGSAIFSIFIDAPSMYIPGGEVHCVPIVDDMTTAGPPFFCNIIWTE